MVPLWQSSGDEAATDDPTPDQRGLTAFGRITKWLEDHPWVITLSIPALVVVKVLRVAEGDIGTAQVILETQGFAGLTSLVLLSAVPAACAVAFIFSLVLVGAIAGAGKWESLRQPAVIFVVTAAVVTGLFNSEWALLIALAVCHPFALGVAWYKAAQRESPGEKGSTDDEIGSHGWPEILWMAIVGIVAGTVMSAASLGTMWAPAESITLEAQSTPVVGYVLADDGNRAVVLLEGDRTTVSYRSEEIEERQRCQLTERQIQNQYPGAVGVFISPWSYDPSSAYPDCPS